MNVETVFRHELGNRLGRAMKLKPRLSTAWFVVFSRGHISMVVIPLKATSLSRCDTASGLGRKAQCPQGGAVVPPAMPHPVSRGFSGFHPITCFSATISVLSLRVMVPSVSYVWFSLCFPTSS